MKENIFSVLSFNLGRFVSRLDKQIVANKILELRPDIIGLQEVDEIKTLFGLIEVGGAKKYLSDFLGKAGYEVRWNRASRVSLIPEVLASVAFRKRDGKLIAFNKQKFEEGLETKIYDIKSYLPYLGLSSFRINMQQICLRFKKNNLKIDFFNNHLNHRENNRLFEISKTRKIIDSIYRKYQNVGIFVGDFNCEPGSLDYKKILEPEKEIPDIKDTFTSISTNKNKSGYTWDSSNSIITRKLNNIVLRTFTKTKETGMKKRRIDYIFLRKSPKSRIRVLSSEVVLNGKYNQENLSDHYGVLTTFGVS